MKKGTIIFLSIISILIVIIVVVIAGFNQQFNALLKDIDTEFATLENIYLSDIPDGIYQYRYGKIPVIVDVSVHVKNHIIESISINDQFSGPGYEALETIDRILAKQQPAVDVVSGATISSKCIMIATYKALQIEN